MFLPEMLNSENRFTAHRTPTEADEPLNPHLSLAETLATCAILFMLPGNAPVPLSRFLLLNLLSIPIERKKLVKVSDYTDKFVQPLA